MKVEFILIVDIQSRLAPVPDCGGKMRLHIVGGGHVRNLVGDHVGCRKQANGVG
jgi:hypothetical protein